MATRLARQQQREDADIDAIIQRMRARKPVDGRMDPADAYEYSRANWIKRQSIAVRERVVAKPVPREYWAFMERRFEEIKNPDQVDLPEKPADKLTDMAVSLVDHMAKENHVYGDQHRAATVFRNLFFTAMGRSNGISSYGEYVASSPPSQRMITSPEQMQAYAELKHAALAAFGVVRKDGRWALDEQLMQIIIPAILSEKKAVTQGAIGKERTRYADKTILRGAGGAIISEVLNRLSLHFQQRER